MCMYRGSVNYFFLTFSIPFMHRRSSPIILYTFWYELEHFLSKNKVQRLCHTVCEVSKVKLKSRADAPTGYDPVDFSLPQRGSQRIASLSGGVPLSHGRINTIQTIAARRHRCGLCVDCYLVPCP